MRLVSMLFWNWTLCLDVDAKVSYMSSLTTPPMALKNKDIQLQLVIYRISSRGDIVRVHNFGKI